MGNQETEPNLTLRHRAAPEQVFVRTMKVVEIGNRALVEAIAQFNYDDACQLGRRMASMWLEGHYAYQIMLLNRDSLPSLTGHLRTLLDRQRELLTLFEVLLKAGVSDALRAEVNPILDLLASIHPAAAPPASQA